MCTCTGVELLRVEGDGREVAFAVGPGAGIPNTAYLSISLAKRAGSRQPRTGHDGVGGEMRGGWEKGSFLTSVMQQPSRDPMLQKLSQEPLSNMFLGIPASLFDSVFFFFQL